MAVCDAVSCDSCKAFWAAVLILAVSVGVPGLGACPAADFGPEVTGFAAAGVGAAAVGAVWFGTIAMAILEVLNASAIHKRQAKDRVDHALHQDAMSTVKRGKLEAIHTNTTNDSRSGSSNIEQDAWEMDVDAILAGAETLDISHVGGEFAAIVDIADDLLGSANR